MNLQDKVVIVTGASRGIGRQIAIEFGRRGSRVVLAARTIERRRTLPGTLGETMQIIEAAGGRAIAVECDVAELADIERLVTTAVDTFGGVDVVVNNAADMIGGDFEELIEAMLGKAVAPSRADPPAPSAFDTWLRQFAINVHGPHMLMTLATPHLRASGGGVIINITSGAADLVALEEALTSPPANPSVGYGVTKAALNRLTNAAAATLAADGIAVVAVDPGVVHTEVRDLLDQGGIGFPHGAPMSVPVAVVLDIVASDNPMAYSGQIIMAQP